MAASVYEHAMEPLRINWRANKGARALKSVGAIQASIEVLETEDLLDLLDIFGEAQDSLLREFPRPR